MDKESLESYGLIVVAAIGAIAATVWTAKNVIEAINFNPKLCSPFMDEFGPTAAKRENKKFK